MASRAPNLATGEISSYGGSRCGFIAWIGGRWPLGRRVRSGPETAQSRHRCIHGIHHLLIPAPVSAAVRFASSRPGAISDGRTARHASLAAPHCGRAARRSMHTATCRSIAACTIECGGDEARTGTSVECLNSANITGVVHEVTQPAPAPDIQLRMTVSTNLCRARRLSINRGKSPRAARKAGLSAPIWGRRRQVGPARLPCRAVRPSPRLSEQWDLHESIDDVALRTCSGECPGDPGRGDQRDARVRGGECDLHEPRA